VQSRQVDEAKIVQRYKERTPRSMAMFGRASKVSPGGVMAGIKFFAPYPLFMKRAAGSRIWDVDGNEYVDYLLSYGALILGHGDGAVREAVNSVFDEVGTTVTGTPSEIESEYGGMLRDIYNKEGLMRFTNSGLEATLLAVRLAKAFTGKRGIAKFEGHYHGANDHLLVSYAPAAKMTGKRESPTPVSDSLDVDGTIISESLVLPFNDWNSTENLIRSNSERLACVIMEPFEEGVIAGDRAFMSKLRGLTTDLGIQLIYDEVKTGFRVRIGGASEYYSITPDVTCLGKIIGGGLPIGAVIGDEEIMRLLGPDAEGGHGVFHSGTFNGNPLSLRVGRATVQRLMEDGNFDRIVRNTEALKRGMSASLSAHQIEAKVVGEGAMFSTFIIAGDVKNYRDVQRADIRFRRNLDMEMICKGVYVKPANRYCLSLAHSEADVGSTREKFDETLDELTSRIPR
jgi:glutamate-1-semialdehyde 2,1-aminomutase